MKRLFEDLHLTNVQDNQNFEIGMEWGPILFNKMKTILSKAWIKTKTLEMNQKDFIPLEELS